MSFDSTSRDRSAVWPTWGAPCSHELEGWLAAVAPAIDPGHPAVAASCPHPLVLRGEPTDDRRREASFRGFSGVDQEPTGVS